MNNHHIEQDPDKEAINHIVKKRGKTWGWVFVGLAAFYLISPIDLIPDIIPVIGWLDDALIGATAVTNLIVKYRRARIK